MVSQCLGALKYPPLRLNYIIARFDLLHYVARASTSSMSAESTNGMYRHMRDDTSIVQSRFSPPQRSMPSRRKRGPVARRELVAKRLASA